MMCPSSVSIFKVKLRLALENVKLRLINSIFDARLIFDVSKRLKDRVRDIIGLKGLD